MNRALTKKLIYVIAAIAMLAMLIPAMAVPVGAAAPVITLTLVNPDGSTAPDSGWNVTGARVLATADMSSNWAIRNVATAPGSSQADFVPPIVNPGTSALFSGIWGDALIQATNPSTNETASAEKKWGQIAYTDISDAGYSPVTWNETTKTWSGSATVTDTVYGAFYEKDPVNPPGESHILIHEVQGVLLNFYLVAGNAPVDMSTREQVGAKSDMAGLPQPNHVTFAGAGDPYYRQIVSDGSGFASVSLNASGEEAVKVVVVPEYPFVPSGVNITVTPEITSWDFYTTEAEVVPQVRWVGEKIVLEKNFGSGAQAAGVVKFSLQNQSVGALEGIATTMYNQQNGATVWTALDSDGFASAILTSSDPGISQVAAGWYTSENGTLLNQHYFTVYWLKFESVTIGDVQGKREFHNSGKWQTPSTVVPTNPWDPTGTYDGLLSGSANITDTTTQTLNVSQDALVRARVKGWFTSSNPSTRLVRNVDPYNSTLDNPTSASLQLPAGRWILPDDWATLAGPNWTQGRMHWDIMCNPDGTVGSSPSELGVYKMPPLTGKTVSGDNVIGPFSPGLELMTPTGWTIPNPGYDSDREIDTVVPDGRLNYWDAPMPPAKVIFQIQNVAGSNNISNSVGFFKPAMKTDVYYIMSGTTVIYTNPFYQEMIPAHPAIPAFINNGGYDWNSFDDSYDAYIFWEFINQHLYAPLVATSDPAGHPTNVTVYSDNHGEAMVWLNGNWNLDLAFWSGKGYADIPFGATVGTTTVQATVDYPYSRIHVAFQSNKDVKTWLWGGRVLGTDTHLFGDHVTQTLTSDTRLVLSGGNYYESSKVGTYPNQAARSDDKVVWVWVTDRDGLYNGVENALVKWEINDGTQAKINENANGWVSNYNSVTRNITLETGFLSGTKISQVSSTVGYSKLRKPTAAEKDLFNKFWGDNVVAVGGGTTIGTSTIRANPDNYCVAAIDLLALNSLSGRVEVTISISSHDFDPVMGQTIPGTVVYKTNVDFTGLDALDDGIRVGDANYDGVVNMGDVTAVERMILGYGAVAANAVLNTDGTVDMGTVVKIERKILGLP